MCVMAVEFYTKLGGQIVNGRRTREFVPVADVEYSVPIARLNRDALRKLAGSRLDEAEVLLKNRLWTGAYYMTGLAVECALKSCLASAVKEHDFPEKKFVNDMYVHSLERLFQLNGALWAALQSDMKTDRRLGVNWSTVKDWDDNKLARQSFNILAFIPSGTNRVSTARVKTSTYRSAS